MVKTINTQDFFYDYFPHISPMRLRTEFNLGLYEQLVISHNVQKIISEAYETMKYQLDLIHYDKYEGRSDEYNEQFYNELKTDIQTKLNDPETWKFLDDLMTKTEITDPMEIANFNTKITASLEYGLPRDTKSNCIILKDALIALFNYDLNALNGQEMVHLIKLE